MIYSLAIKQMNTHTDAGVLQAYLKAREEGREDEVNLSEALQRKLERIERCKKLIVTEIATAKVLEAMVREFGISKRQAYNDLNDCKQVFGERQIWEEQLFQNLLETRKIALAKMDTKGLNQNDKNLAEAIAKFKGSQETDLWADKAPPVLVWGNVPEPEMPREALEAELEKFMAARGKQVKEIEAEEVEYEEIKPPKPPERLEL